MSRPITPIAQRRLTHLLLGLAGLLAVVALSAATYHASPGTLMMASWVMVSAGTVGLVAMVGVVLVVRRRESAFERELRQLMESEASPWR
ncbi:MAG: hypothetical protein ACRD0C_10790 [Acidimicrobiia bacterium]